MEMMREVNRRTYRLSSLLSFYRCVNEVSRVSSSALNVPGDTCCYASVAVLVFFSLVCWFCRCSVVNMVVCFINVIELCS